MFASASTDTDDAAGFGVPRARLALDGLRARMDDMLVFYVVAGAMLAAILVSAWQSAQVTPVVPRVVEIERAAQKADRLRPAIDMACHGAAYGAETAECRVAIAHDGGREPAGELRIVTIAAAGNG